MAGEYLRVSGIRAAGRLFSAAAALILLLAATPAALGQAAPPALVSFGPGGVAAVRSGRTPEGLPVQYLLRLGAGQTLLLNLASDGDGISLDVNQLDTNQPVFESPLSRSLQAAVPIPSDGSYLITLHPATGQDLPYRLDMVAPAIALPANPVSTAFPAPGHIVVVGEAGSSAGQNQETVYSSMDNGSTWRKAAIDGKAVGVRFTDGNHGLLAMAVEKQANGSLGPCLYATADGGATWRPVEMPLPKDIYRKDITSLTPSAPRFLNGSQGSVDVQLTFTKGPSQQLRYVTVDDGETWTIRSGAAAPFVPDAVESQKELTGCLSDNELQGGRPQTGAFKGRPISQWIAQVQRDFSMPVVMLSASISPDGQRLVVTFAGCHTSQVQPGPFTVFAVVDARGRVSYLRDNAGKPSYLDGFETANSEGVYQFIGWLADSRTMLINAEPYNLGAGGSCEPTLWVTYDADGQPGATFQTVGSYATAKGNSVLFYVGPGACQGALNQIHKVQTATGKDTIVYTGPQDAIIEIAGAFEAPDGAFEIRYHVPGGKEQKLRVP